MTVYQTNGGTIVNTERLLNDLAKRKQLDDLKAMRATYFRPYIVKKVK